MKIVVDSNRIIAALISDGTTRELIFNKEFEFFAPDYMKIEIEKYKDEIIEKAGLQEDEFDVLFSILFDKIKILSLKEYEGYLKEFSESLSDFKDVAYLAVCKKINAEGIWTHDSGFREQKVVKVFSNIDLLNYLRNLE